MRWSERPERADRELRLAGAQEVLVLWRRQRPFDHWSSEQCGLLFHMAGIHTADEWDITTTDWSALIGLAKRSREAGVDCRAVGAEAGVEVLQPRAAAAYVASTMVGHGALHHDLPSSTPRMPRLPRLQHLDASFCPDYGTVNPSFSASLR